MIRLPKGRVLQKNIDTTYVRLDGVLHSLSAEAFTGYVRIVGEDSEGLLYFRDGRLIAGQMERGEELHAGPRALVDILSSVGRRRSFLDICKLEPDLLAAVLAVTHGTAVPLAGGAAPADLPGLVEVAAESGGVTGAFLAESATGSHYIFFADGEILGEYRPDVEEWSDVPAVFPQAITPWKLWHLPGATALRTIDLEAQKSQAWDAVRDLVERYAPGFGGHLLELECRRHLIAEPRKMLKAEFVELGTEMERRVRLVIGARRATALAGELSQVTDSMIDAGI